MIKTDCSFNTRNGNSVNPNHNPNPNVNDLRSSCASNPRNNTNKAVTRKCNRCNKTLTDFDESKFKLEIVLQLKIIVKIVLLL